MNKFQIALSMVNFSGKYGHKIVAKDLVTLISIQVLCAPCCDIALKHQLDAGNVDQPGNLPTPPLVFGRSETGEQLVFVGRCWYYASDSVWSDQQVSSIAAIPEVRETGFSPAKISKVVSSWMGVISGTGVFTTSWTPRFSSEKAVEERAEHDRYKENIAKGWTDLKRWKKEDCCYLWLQG